DPRAYGTYKLSDNVNVYASVAKGFRSGGFNLAGQPPYEPESLITYELGTKGLSADGVWRFELSGYYSNYRDMLRRGLVLVSIGGTPTLTSLTSNLGTVHIKGAEGGLTWRATKQLTLNATASRISSEIVRGPASFELFGTNLTNENRWVDPYHAWGNANRTAPRMIGASVQYDFR